MLIASLLPLITYRRLMLAQSRSYNAAVEQYLGGIRNGLEALD